MNKVEGGVSLDICAEMETGKGRKTKIIKIKRLETNRFDFRPLRTSPAAINLQNKHTHTCTKNFRVSEQRQKKTLKLNRR